MAKWISAKERLPEEHDKVFTYLYGTPKWSKRMWRTESDKVLVVLRYRDGYKRVTTGETHDGKWYIDSFLQATVTHWQPLPEPPVENE